jgi:hypothetical protein
VAGSASRSIRERKRVQDYGVSELGRMYPCICSCQKDTRGTFCMDRAFAACSVVAREIDPTYR